MIFSNDILIRVIILILGIFGFWVAKHIRDHKTKNKPLVCMVGFDCHAVVHSDYSKFLGVPVEVFGMIYYAFTTLFYFFLIFSGYFISELPEPMIFALLPIGTLFWALSLVAFLFSLYLIAVQIFILKKGCSWCIVSALISALIFITQIF